MHNAVVVAAIAVVIVAVFTTLLCCGVCGHEPGSNFCPEDHDTVASGKRIPN
jgi:hypothetical protein